MYMRPGRKPRAPIGTVLPYTLAELMQLLCLTHVKNEQPQHANI